MNLSRSAVFLIHLVQDVNILRPLVFMATQNFGFDALLLVSTKFVARDQHGIWATELNEISQQSGARLAFFDDDLEARQHFTGTGLVFSASESHLHNHQTTHNVFRYVPPTYLKVTLQHGFECVGFRHSTDHVRAHGSTASFGADIVCAWYGGRLTSLAPSQRGKLLVTGPTSLLHMPASPANPGPDAPGLVCENLHSVRFTAAGSAKSEFVAAFEKFARVMAGSDKRIALRPHAGGQFFVKNRIPLPPNVTIENAPLYRMDLRKFAYGISAPSSVVIDLLLAGVPTAVWRDSNGSIDTAAYDGLPTVSSAKDWVRFARSARDRRERLLADQARFLEREEIVMDPREVFSRFAELFQAAQRMEIRPAGALAERERLLFVANGRVPTLQLSFEKPLEALVARGEIASRLLTEPELGANAGRVGDEDGMAQWIGRCLDTYNPSAIIFCRYSGPGHGAIVSWARRAGVPVIYHIDDDLLAIPRDIGERKHAYHNAPERVEAVTGLLQAADLVYASTRALEARLAARFPGTPIVAGDLYCSGEILRRAEPGVARKVGYMASADHAHNLEMVLPAIEKLLDRNPELRFELFGSIPIPEPLKRFGQRISTASAIADYDEFLERFAMQEWDVGICPLTPIEFNMTKADTKWVEYTAAGAAVVASRGTVYDECCSGGSGLLADTVDEWFSALDLLVNNGDERVAMVELAQSKLEQEYSVGRLRQQVLDVIVQARGRVGSRSGRAPDQEKERVCQLP